MGLIPIFAWVVLGWIFRKQKWLNHKYHQRLETMTFQWLIPIMLFWGTYSAENLASLDLTLLAAFYLPLLIVFFLALALFKRLGQPHSNMLALASTYSNNVLVGIPILLSMVGEAILLPAFVIISIHSLVLFILAEFTVQNTTQPLYKKLPQAAIKTLKNPIVFSLLIGFCANWIDFELPSFLSQTLPLMKYIALPCALMTLGSALYTFGMQGQLKWISLISVIKLVALPMLVWVSARHIFQLSDSLVVVLVILSASPVGINGYAYAARANQQPKTVGATVLFSTLLCLVSQPIWLLMLL